MSLSKDGREAASSLSACPKDRSHLHGQKSHIMAKIRKEQVEEVL